MAGFGDFLQQAGSLGLAGAKTALQGLGLAQPQREPGLFGTQPYRPPDFSDQNPLQQLLMRAGNAVASSQGQPLPSQELSAQRAAGNDQRVKAFQQGIDLLTQFHGIRDKAAPGDFERVDGLLKKRFAEMAGGKPGEADEFYDSFMSGGAGATAGLLKLLANDAGAQQMIASGATTADLRNYAADLSHKGIILGDQEALPRVLQKFEAITAGTGLSPEVRAKFDAIAGPGRRWTIDSIRELNGELPPDLQLTADEWAVAKRHESDIAGMNGMQATPEILERRKAGIDSAKQQEIDAARIKEQLNADLQKIKKQAELRPAQRPVSQSAQMNLQFRISQQRAKYRADEANIEQLLKAPATGPGAYQLAQGFVHILDNTAAREGEVATLRSEAASMSDRVKRIMSTVEGGSNRILGPQQMQEIKTIMEGYRQKVHSLHTDFVKEQVRNAEAWGGEENADKMIPGWREFLSGDKGGDAAGAPPSGEAATAGAGKPKTITQNGHTYTLNEKTGGYE